MAYQSILNSSSRQLGHLITCSNAYFDFDVVTIEQHTSKLKLTDNPVESGTKITDHAILEPKELTINGILVGYTPSKKNVSNTTKSYSFNNYKLPIDIKTMTPQLERRISQISSAYSAITSKDQQIDTDFLPTYRDVKNDLSSSVRIANGYEMLLNLQQSGGLLTFQTSLKHYSNMMIVSISASQQKMMTGEFSIVMREVFVVNTQKASGLKQNLGITRPQKINKNSVLNSTKSKTH